VPSRICPEESVDTLVTDSAAGQDTVRVFTEAGIGVVTG
jgi:DeoR family transcriptional regulator of aga operon